MTPEEAHNTLVEIAEQLSAKVILEPEHAGYLLGAIIGYLSGAAPTMDRALGLVRKKGRPRHASKHLELAKRIVEMRFPKWWTGNAHAPGSSWHEISTELNIDPRELQRIERRYHDAIVAHYAAELERHRRKKARKGAPCV